MFLAKWGPGGHMDLIVQGGVARPLWKLLWAGVLQPSWDAACPPPEAWRRQPHTRPRARVLPHLQQEQRGRMPELVPDQSRQPRKKAS